MAINGSLTYQQRAKIVAKFKADPTFRVLIFSKVGTVGLNLTEADILIFLVCYLLMNHLFPLTFVQDQQWSDSENDQAIGRLYRQGQQRPVTIFHVLASGSIDFFLYALAKSKGTMSEAFLSSAISQVSSEKQRSSFSGLYQSLSLADMFLELVELASGYQHLADEGEDEDEEVEAAPKPKRKAKGKGKEVEVNGEAGRIDPSAKKVKRKKALKSSTFVIDRDTDSDVSMPGAMGTSGSERSMASTPPMTSEGEGMFYVGRQVL